MVTEWVGGGAWEQHMLYTDIKAMTADRFSIYSYTQMDKDYICFQEHCSFLPEMKKGAVFWQILLYVPE